MQNQEVDTFRDRIRTRLTEAEGADELAAGIAVEQVVHECLVLVDGLSVQAVMYPAEATRRGQLALLDALLARISA